MTVIYITFIYPILGGVVSERRNKVRYDIVGAQ